MRTNLPVTNNEITLKDDVLIVSKTDLKGQITYVNRDFTEVSGYSENELMGQPHNLVRHPDMPSWAFADLWKTIASGHPWRGIVKNRAKNGDYYWVRATASPITESGRVIGYLSVRCKPARDEVLSADALYRSGEIPSGGSSLLNRFKNLSLQTKLQVLIQSAIFIMTSAATFAIAHYVKVSILDGVHQRAEGIANEVIDSANMLMVTAQISDPENRKLLISKISDTGHIVGLRLVRTEQVVKQFGPGLPEEHIKDDVESSAIASKTPYYAVEQRVNGPVYRAVTPYVVSHNFHGTDCLMCHQVEVGSVNGASDIEIDISGDMQKYQGMVIGLIVGTVILQLILFVFIKKVMHRFVTRPVEDILAHLRDLSSAKMSTNIDIARRDELGEVQCAIQSAQILLGSMINETHSLADATMRIKIALDDVNTGVMIADPYRNIIYTNKAVVRILKSVEDDIRKFQPSFNADNLVGSCIDQFHKNPSHQANLLATLNRPYSADLEIGNHHLTVLASPVINSQGERLGSVAEWSDRTTEILIEREVAEIVRAASSGDLSKRIEEQGKEGFFAALSVGLNKLLNTTQDALDTTSEVLNRVAKGDLTKTVTEDYQGIFGKIKDDTNSTVERLREIVGKIKEATDAINLAAREIAAGNAELSSRTEEQASNLDRTATSTEQMTSTVKQNADNAKQANQLAIGSSEIAAKGGEAVNQVVQTMNSINESSRKIVEIISVIDGIAFQTNILALNAAVEAARAGEQGRGFAVVASEVRNLAKRSADAAKEIKSLIGDSVKKVEGGSKLVVEAGRTMEEVVTSVKHVTAIMSEISSASEEQSVGIEQVNLAISKIDDVTQQNASLVEEASAAAGSLQDEAQRLTKLVSVFIIEESTEKTRRDTTHVTSKSQGTAAQPLLPQMKAGAGARIMQIKQANDDEQDWQEF